MAAWLLNLGFAGGATAEAVQDTPTGGWDYERPRGVPRRDDDADLFRTLAAFIEVINETNLD